jgi:ABC-type nickel/cobalt efflux system permease component RcnA
MRRTLFVAAVLAALLVPASPAGAHPLGNFSINHLSTVRIDERSVRVGYVLDQAEIPTVQERGVQRADLVARKLAEVRERLRLTVRGERVPLAVTGTPRLSYRPGAGGLKTTRLEVALRAAVSDPRRVELRDETFPGRVGWKAIVAAPGHGTAVRTRAPSDDPTDGLRRYPRDLLSSPLDNRVASFSVKPGDGTLVAPTAPGGALSESHADGTTGFAGLFADAAAGQGVIALLLLAALGWGALHALSPGHGKAMVAAYLVGTRGRPRHAVALGVTVTVTHTIGVFALGVVTLGLSQYVLPEDLYPWLTLVSGLMVVGVGAAVLRSRVRRARADAHPHEHAHDHDHGHDHHHSHPHHHELGWRGILGMGTAAGLIPCPSALVVLLAAISQHQVALGLLLIVAFSVGLAATLTVLGLAVVYARRVIPARLTAGRIAAALPAASALLIVGVGLLLTARAVPGVV